MPPIPSLSDLDQLSQAKLIGLYPPVAGDENVEKVRPTRERGAI